MKFEKYIFLKSEMKATKTEPNSKHTINQGVYVVKKLFG
jgi:hypothetical protein